ncbi:hypothetical protein BMETH_1634_0 [methanotrophic bacterial endosymbiont of Bathymodiolus sp.]|nr:hypothetical protein BMETH_1634_0 [methanotrophic bacterial endosymbiont of Bathymodiolus sp.]
MSRSSTPTEIRPAVFNTPRPVPPVRPYKRLVRLDTIMIFLGISITPRVILASDLSAFCPTLGPYGSSVTSAAFSSAA